MIRFLKYVKDRLVYLRSDLHYRLRFIFPIKTISGVRLFVNDNESLSRELLMSVLQGGYEDLENAIIRKNLQPTERVLELGCGIGFIGITAAKINDNKVLSYELNPRLHDIISKNQALNAVKFEVRNEMLACGQAGSAQHEFYVARNACMSSTVTDQLPKFELSERLRVETASLEAVFLAWRPEFLIVDIEGGEKDLFQCSAMLKHSTLNKILVEIHAEIIGREGADQVCTRIREAGFEPVPDQCIDEVYFFTRVR